MNARSTVFCSVDGQAIRAKCCETPYVFHASVVRRPSNTASPSSDTNVSMCDMALSGVTPGAPVVRSTWKNCAGLEIAAVGGPVWNKGSHLENIYIWTCDNKSAAAIHHR